MDHQRDPALTGLLEEILRAEKRIRGRVQDTPLVPSTFLSLRMGSDVYLKMENLQLTGSFKVRGAMNKLLAMDTAARDKGVVAASTGNHGAAVAFAAGQLGIGSTIFVPQHASASKVAAMKRLGAEVRFHGDDCVVAEDQARNYAGLHGIAYISPYNDLEVVAGQGTIGVEIGREVDDLQRIFVSVGGGGLIAGIACYLKVIFPQIRVVGCSPQASCVMFRSLEAGRLLDLPSEATLSDGTAGGVEPESITFELCRMLVDEWILVPEEEIAAAMRCFIETHHMLIEGSAAVALAALARAGCNSGNGNNLVLLCGANVSLPTLRSVLGADMEQ